MLSKNNRLSSRREFSELRKTGRMINSESFGFLYSFSLPISLSPSLPPFPTSSQNPPHFFFIVSTKISKKATERNLIKRRLRAIVRELSIPSQIFAAFFCKKKILGKTYAELKKEVENVIKQLR